MYPGDSLASGWVRVQNGLSRVQQQDRTPSLAMQDLRWKDAVNFECQQSGEKKKGPKLEFDRRPGPGPCPGPWTRSSCPTCLGGGRFPSEFRGRCTIPPFPRLPGSPFPMQSEYWRLFKRVEATSTLSRIGGALGRGGRVRAPCRTGLRGSWRGGACYKPTDLNALQVRRSVAKVSVFARVAR